jgi:hypothetical protein
MKNHLAGIGTRTSFLKKKGGSVHFNYRTMELGFIIFIRIILLLTIIRGS